MRIGIDIDGVLTEEKKYIIDYGTKFFIENNISYTINDDNFYGQEIFGVTKEQYKKFLNNYIFEYSKNVKVRPFASEIIKKLKKAHEVFIITARDLTTYENKYQIKMQQIVKKWLYDNDILYDEIIFSKNKDIICEEKEIDIMIEDNPENIIAISKKIPVICYNNIYNRKICNNNVYRCFSWYDIYNKINNLYSAKN